MDKAAARRFLEKYAAGNYTAAEHQAFHQWILSRPLAETQALLQEYSQLLQQDEQYISADPQLFERIEELIYEQSSTVKYISAFRRNRHRLLYAAAAVIILLVIAGIYRMREPQYQAAPVVSSSPGLEQDIAPGGDKAVLTLADGSKITLDQASQGMLARQGLTKVVKLNSGELSYEAENGAAGPAFREVLYNTIETPRGGQYHLTLPDGTEVWLNAASSLRYPTTFSGPERNVVLKGEAYFEVASSTSAGRHAGKPFHVEVNGMKVSVLGTHFNVMAYGDESQVKTTLLEGSVQISADLAAEDPLQLYPGQQARFDKKSNQLNVAEVDPGVAVAWKNGYFRFNRADIYTIMRQVARWYDLEVVYEGTMPKEEFVGTISRDEPLSRVLKIFRLSNIRFRLEEGKKIVVMR